jgi:hypothetical protein
MAYCGSIAGPSIQLQTQTITRSLLLVDHVGRYQRRGESAHRCHPLSQEIAEEARVFAGRQQVEDVLGGLEGVIAFLLGSHVLECGLVCEGEEGDYEGSEANAEANAVVLLPIELEQLHLACHAQVVKGPVEEVQHLRNYLKEGGQLLLPVEHQLHDRLVLVHALEDSEQFPSLPDRLYVQRGLQKSDENIS